MTQKAYSGDLIRVTKAFDEPYSIGDVMTVDMRMSDMGACDDEIVITTEGYSLFDDEYAIVEATEKVVLMVTDKQVEEVVQLYKRACQLQSNIPCEDYDPTEIQTIMNVCRRLGIDLPDNVL